MNSARPEVVRPDEVTVEFLAEAAGYTTFGLRGAASRIEARGYTQFILRKSNRGRVVCAPAPWLSAIQSSLARRVLSLVQPSDRVYSVRGRDTIKNALVHANNPYMLVLDIRDCYPSVTVAAVREGLLGVGFSREVAGILTRLVTFHGSLPQGAPTSSAVLDCVLRPVDDQLDALACEHGAIYTRYADDICFSASTSLATVRRRAVRVLDRHGFAVGARKSRLYGPDDVKTVTKIEIDRSLRPHRPFLHEVDALIHAFRRHPNPALASSIRGKIGWIDRLNPELGALYSARLDSVAGAPSRRRSR